MPETEKAEAAVVPAKPRRKSKSTALTTYRRLDLSRRYLPPPAGADLRRWFLYEGQGMSVIDIAAREGNTNPDIVQASIDYINEYKFRNQLSIVNAKFVQVAMEQLDDAGAAIKGAMKATKVIHVDRDTGKVKTAPDHAMRLKGVAETRAMIETMQPRTPGVMVNQQFNTAVAGYSGGGGMSFESVLRRKREMKGLANEQEVETVDAELTHDEQIADEFKDFGGDEDDEGDEDESPA